MLQSRLFGERHCRACSLVFIRSITFAFKGTKVLLYTMVKKSVLPYKISTLPYHTRIPIYGKMVYSKHVICQQLVNQVFLSSSISH